MSHTSHPGNIGSAARAMKTMGLSRLYLVKPKHFPSAEAVSLSCGAEDVLENAVVCNSLDEALAGTVYSVAVTARRRDLSHQVHDSRQIAPMVLAEASGGEVALVFGTEMSGLTTEEIGKCQAIAEIPANPDYSSLNLAQAVQVMAYELRMCRPDSEPVAAKVLDAASFEEIEHFYQHLEETLVKIGFLDPNEPKRLMQRLRRLFARSRLEKIEVNILRGILRDLAK